MHINQWMRRGLIMLIRSQSLLTLCNPSLSSVLHIIYSTVKKKKKGPQWQTGYLAEQKETCCRHPSIHPSIHVAGPSNPPDNPWLYWVFFFSMTGTLIGVGLLWKIGAPQLTKARFSSPSAALMGRANSDPSPVEHQLGQSIVSYRVPAFRVTSPSAGSFSKKSLNRGNKCCQPFLNVKLQPYMMIDTLQYKQLNQEIHPPQQKPLILSIKSSTAAIIDIFGWFRLPARATHTTHTPEQNQHHTMTLSLQSPPTIRAHPSTGSICLENTQLL